MRKLFLMGLITILPFSAMAGPQEDGQAIFEKFLSDFTSANADAVASHFAPEAIFWGTNERALITSPAGIKDYFGNAFNRLPGAKASSVGNVSAVKVNDNAMAVSGIWQIDRVVDGKPISSQNRNSLTLVKRGDRWLILSFMNSPRPPAP